MGEAPPGARLVHVAVEHEIDRLAVERTGGLQRTDHIAVVAPVTDPLSGQPASKNVAVSARSFEAISYGFAVSATRPEGLDTPYWALAKADGGWRLELQSGTIRERETALPRAGCTRPWVAHRPKARAKAPR